MGVGQKWGKPDAIQCPVMPNGYLSTFVNEAQQPLLVGAVWLFRINTLVQSACVRTDRRYFYSLGI